jgi:hypothetical protein
VGRPRGIFGERLGARLDAREEEEGKPVGKERLGLGFIGKRHGVEERESRRTAGLRSTGGTDVPHGLAWRPLGTGGLDVVGRWRASKGGEGGGRACQGTRGAKESGAGLQGAREVAGGGGVTGAAKNRGGRGWRKKMRTYVKFFRNAGTSL